MLNFNLDALTSSSVPPFKVILVESEPGHFFPFMMSQRAKKLTGVESNT